MHAHTFEINLQTKYRIQTVNKNVYKANMKTIIHITHVRLDSDYQSEYIDKYAYEKIDMFEVQVRKDSRCSRKIWQPGQ